MTPTEPADRALRRLRPLVAAALLAYVTIRSNDAALGRGLLAAMAVCSAALLGIGRLTARLRGSGLRAERVADGVTVAIDGFVTVLAITRFDVIDAQLAWALLLVPVLEGALRFRMRGVVVVWCAVTAMYVGLQLRMPSDLSDPVTQAAFLAQVQTLVYRAGIVLLVAVPGGFLSDQLLRAIASQRVLQLAAAERNAVLVGVVDAGRSIGRSGIDLPAAVEAAARDLGFARAEWLVRDPREGWPDDGFGALASAVAAHGATMRAGRDDADPMVGAELDLAGLEEVVAAPIRSRDETVAVLRVATPAGVPPTVPQIEGLELLAAQAGVAGDNARLLTDLDAARADLEHQATHDGLTGLPNRTLFHRTLADRLAELSDRPRPLAVLFLDLDRFKAVNDDLGHDVGDELLVAASRRIQVLLRPDALCARLGGDEFIVLAPDTTNEAAGMLAGRIVERLSEPFRLSGHTVEVGASVGVVVTDRPIDADELVRRGDLAMYRAKHGGRSTWCVYEPGIETARDEAPAIPAPEPLVDARTGRTTIDVSVALAAGSSLLRSGHDVGALLVQLGVGDVAPGSMVLALAERDLADIACRPTIGALRAAGVRIALDGLGAGTMPLADLIDLPVDVVRLAPALAIDVAASSRQQAVVTALLHLAHDLGIAVVATGVRAGVDAEALRRLGCDRLQGPLFQATAPQVVR